MHRIFTTLVLFHILLSGHGFGGNTHVKTAAGYWESIEQLVEYSDTQYVMSYHCDSTQCHSHKILARSRSITNCYFTINVDGYPAADIICSPLQQFYLPEKHCWTLAHDLHVGDVLLTEREGNLPIVRIAFVDQQLEFYALKIEHPHTFFVGRHSVLTHNMDLPVASLCWELPLTISTLSAAGGVLTGCAATASGVAVGAIAASLIYSAVIDHKAKKYHDVQIPKDNMLLFAQKQSNTPKPPPSGNNNSHQPPNQSQDPNDKKPRCTDKVGNMHELFKRKGFGEDLKRSSEKISKIDTHTDSQVYKITKDMPQYGLKTGDKCYLDKCHKDHVEIFRGKKPYKVLNLDGSLNVGKTHAAVSRKYDVR